MGLNLGHAGPEAGILANAQRCCVQNAADLVASCLIIQDQLVVLQQARIEQPLQESSSIRIGTMMMMMMMMVATR
jgi:hypothetical protein